MQTYLPTVHGNPDVTPARQFAAAWMLALGERAKIMTRDDRLTKCAGDHADYLAQRQGAEIQQSMHIGSGGSLPDQRVRTAGYALPDHWHSNHVESCATHTGGPQAALDMLLDSPGHRAHLLGIGGFEGHRVWGVGNERSYYVVICAPGEVR